MYRWRMVTGSDLPSDWWTTENVATALGVSASTIRAYLARNQMPAPDRTIGKMRLWRPDTIRNWHASRPRKQAQGRRERLRSAVADEVIGDLIATVRRANGWSQNDLGQRLNLASGEVTLTRRDLPLLVL